MNEKMEQSLNFLCSRTDNKIRCLSQILTITENLETLYQNLGDDGEWGGMPDGKSIMDEMNKEKQKLIQQVHQEDLQFNATFNNLGGDFEKEAAAHGPLVKLLQKKIAAVMDLDEKIKTQENQNRHLLDQYLEKEKPAGLPRETTYPVNAEYRHPQKSLKKHVLAQYRNNTKKK